MILTKCEIANLKNLNNLDLEERFPARMDLAELVEILNDNRNITFLNMRYNNIKDEGAKILVGLKHIKTLDLSYNDISEVGASALLKNLSLEKLLLEVNCICFEAIPEIMQLCPAKLEIFLANNLPPAKSQQTATLLAKKCKDTFSKVKMSLQSLDRSS
jgi:hypothetical protein